MKYKGDIPLVAYINFETTVPTNECLDPENRKTFAVLYVIISAFHPKLDIDRVIIERSFGHSRKKLTSFPPGNKTSWRRRNYVFLYVQLTS